MKLQLKGPKDIESYSDMFRLKMVKLPLKGEGRPEAYLLKDEKSFDCFILKNDEIKEHYCVSGAPSDVWKYAVNVALNLEEKVADGVCFIEEIYKAFLKYSEKK